MKTGWMQAKFSFFFLECSFWWLCQHITFSVYPHLYAVQGSHFGLCNPSQSREGPGLLFPSHFDVSTLLTLYTEASMLYTELFPSHQEICFLQAPCCRSVGDKCERFMYDAFKVKVLRWVYYLVLAVSVLSLRRETPCAVDKGVFAGRNANWQGYWYLDETWPCNWNFYQWK